MFGFIVGQGAPLYSSHLVDLAINFIFDGKDLLAKEHSEEMLKDRYGYGGYLRVQTSEGVHNPLVLAYMEKYFNQFRGITELCNTLEATVKRYDEKWWEGMKSYYSSKNYSEILESNMKRIYLLRFISKSDLARALINL